MEIDDLIVRKQNELLLVQRELDALQLARNLMKHAKTEEEAAKGATPSQPVLMAEVLRAKNRPMTHKELARALGKKLGRKVKPESVSSVIYRNIKLGKLFRKVADKANTFALIEWPLTSNEQERVAESNGRRQVGAGA
jgi:hypothetical protein